jgi:hypothetical protein
MAGDQRAGSHVASCGAALDGRDHGLHVVAVVVSTGERAPGDGKAAARAQTHTTAAARRQGLVCQSYRNTVQPCLACALYSAYVQVDRPILSVHHDQSCGLLMLRMFVF